MYPMANTDFRCARLGLNTLGLGRDLHDNATVSADLPLVARRAELALLTDAIEAARCGRGEAVLLAGERAWEKPSADRDPARGGMPRRTRTWPEPASPHARQRFCGLSTPDSAMPASPIAYSSRARTVESHVSRILQKTGLTTREQLPSASSAED